jgi:hypothetical protein
MRTYIGHVELGDSCVRGPGHDTWGNPDIDDPLQMTFREHLVRLLWSLSIFWTEKNSPFDKNKHPELVVPRKRKEIDGMTQWIANVFIPLYRSFKARFKEFYHSFQAKCKKDNDLPHTENMEERTSSPSITQALIRAFSKKLRAIFLQVEETSDEKNDATEILPTLDKYHMSSMRKFTYFFSTILACLLPTVAIAVLSTIHGQAKLIGFIALFTAIFAAGLMLLTSSGTPRTEIFTATAA